MLHRFTSLVGVEYTLRGPDPASSPGSRVVAVTVPSGSPRSGGHLPADRNSGASHPLLESVSDTRRADHSGRGDRLNCPSMEETPVSGAATLPASHRHSIRDRVRKGRDVERAVWSRARGWHLEDRVLVHGNKTVVFK